MLYSTDKVRVALPCPALEPKYLELSIHRRIYSLFGWKRRKILDGALTRVESADAMYVLSPFEHFEEIHREFHGIPRDG